MSDKQQLLKNAYRLLKSPGKLLVVEWKKNTVPIGPPMNNRIDQEQAEVWFMNLGLRKARELNADSFHYAVMFEKV